MKKLIKKILDFVFNAKNERLILIGLPCICILVALAILVPAASTFYDSFKTSGVTSSPTVTPSAQVQFQARKTTEPLITAEPEKTSEILIDEKNIHLTATSTENDLYIFVRDEGGTPVSNEVFKIIVKYPGGQIGSYNSNTDGSCYLVKLSAGDYTVSMEQKTGFSEPDPIVCKVNERISYSYIEEIEDIVDVTQVNIIIDEVKVNEAEAPEEIVAEVITSSGSTGTIPMYDSNGNIIYTYTWQTDEQGHLLDSDGNPTEVFPYYEEEGKLLWGFKLDGTTTREEVKLINNDNTPVEGYAITATPLYSEKVGGWLNENGNVFYITDDGNMAVGLKSIDGNMYYFDSSGKKANSLGVDVSFYNGTINWSAVKNSGIDFVIIRLGGRGWGTGMLYDDSCFYNYLNGAKSAGLKVGVYFYSTATNRVEAVQEASIALDRLKGVNLDYPVYIDMEYSGDYPNGRADKLTRAERVEICTAFCETIKNSGYRPGLYSSESFLWEGIDYNSISSYSIWMASYTENNSLPATTYRYDIWQISDRGRVPGINGNCDINIIR